MRNFYQGQLYVPTDAGEVLRKLEENSSTEVISKGYGVYEVVLPVKYKVQVLAENGLLLGLSSEIDQHVMVKVIINNILASFAENIAFAREIEKYVEGLSKKRLKIKPNQVVKILENDKVVMFYGITNEIGSLLTNRSKAIEILKKKKKWKGWLGIGLYIRDNKYVEIDLYSDGRMSIPRDDEVARSITSWLSKVLQEG